MNEAIRIKRVRKLEIRDAATNTMANYTDENAREGTTIKYVSGDNSGELGRVIKFKDMLVNLGIR